MGCPRFSFVLLSEAFEDCLFLGVHCDRGFWVSRDHLLEFLLRRRLWRSGFPVEFDPGDTRILLRLGEDDACPLAHRLAVEQLGPRSHLHAEEVEDH